MAKGNNKPKERIADSKGSTKKTRSFARTGGGIIINTEDKKK